jgi:hypothetical protein
MLVKSAVPRQFEQLEDVVQDLQELTAEPVVQAKHLEKTGEVGQVGQVGQVVQIGPLWLEVVEAVQKKSVAQVVMVEQLV